MILAVTASVEISFVSDWEPSGELLAFSQDLQGVTDTARKTNYDFERRERERSKAADTAKKAQAKADKRASEEEPAEPQARDE